MSDEPRKSLKPKPHECMESWAQELHARASRVRQLIGSHHWQSDGFHKEAVLKAFFARHLPSRLKIDRGFVAHGTDPDAISPEIDLLVSDPELSLSWFAEEGLQIVPPSSVVAHIHVKSTLTQKSLDDAFDSGGRTGDILASGQCGKDVWAGAFFFATTFGLNIPKAIAKGIRKVQKLGRPVIESVCSLDGHFARITCEDSCRRNPKHRLRVFDLGELAPAAMLVSLFSCIAVGRTSSQRMETEQLLASLSEDACVFDQTI